jgi:hypothetical protein
MRSWQTANYAYERKRLEMALKKGQFVGKENPNWKGGRLIASNGYVLVRLPDHPLADVRGYVYEHRVVAEQTIGRPLLPTEQVHHKDGNKQNNHPDNLQVMPSQFHHRVMHRTTGFTRRRPGEDNPLIACACGCGTQLRTYDGDGRPRAYIPGHNGRINPIEDNAVVECACGCGTQFDKYSEDGKLRHNSKIYRFKRDNPLLECACGCGMQFRKYDTSGRPRRFISGHNARRS